MVREIIRNARNPVKNRVIPQKVTNKYIEKVKRLEPEIIKVTEEERAEREIASLENKTNRMQNQLEHSENGGVEPERTWFKNRDAEKEEKAKQQKLSRKKQKRKMAFEDDEDKSNYYTGEYISRDAKRARKPKKIRTVYDPAVNGGSINNAGAKAQRKKKTSAFDEEITNVKAKNVKKMRHEGNQAKRMMAGKGSFGGKKRGGKR